MNRVLVIYDLSGQIWNIVYGATEVPQGLPSVWVDLPENAILQSIDPITKEPVFTYVPETTLGQLEHTVGLLQSQVAENEEQTASDISALQDDAEATMDDITDIQIALAEVYEVLLGSL